MRAKTCRTPALEAWSSLPLGQTDGEVKEAHGGGSGFCSRGRCNSIYWKLHSQSAGSAGSLRYWSCYGYIKNNFTQHEGSSKEVKTFLRIVEELHRELEEIKKLCEDLQRESVGAETGNIQTLRDDIDELLNNKNNTHRPAAYGDHTTHTHGADM